MDTCLSSGNISFDLPRSLGFRNSLYVYIFIICLPKTKKKLDGGKENQEYGAWNAYNSVQALYFRERLKRLEEGFTSNVKNSKLREYNALHDPNMRHFFENRKLQMHLYTAGLVSWFAY